MKLALVLVPVMMLALLACGGPATPAPNATPTAPSANPSATLAPTSTEAPGATVTAPAPAQAGAAGLKHAPTAVAVSAAVGPIIEGLFDAVEKGDLETVKKLLPPGAAVDIVDENGFTPLMTAASVGQHEVMRYLIDQGAGVNSGRTMDRATPLIVAAYFKRTEAGKLLVERGADVNLADDSGLCPLHLAADGGNEELAKVLLEAGADPNVFTTRGWDPLFLALRMQYVSMTRLLLDHGADANTAYSLTQPYPHSPLDIAAWTGNDEIIKMLIDKGGRVPWLGEVPGFDPYDFHALDVSLVDGDVRVSGASQPLFLGSGSVVRPWRDPNTEPEDKTGTNFFTWTDREAHEPITILVLQDARGHMSVLQLVLPVFLGKEGVSYGEGVTEVAEGGPFVTLRVHADEGMKGKVVVRRGERGTEQEIGADGLATFDLTGVSWNEPLAIDVSDDASGATETIDVDCVGRAASPGGVIYDTYLKDPAGNSGN